LRFSSLTGRAIAPDGVVSEADGMENFIVVDYLAEEEKLEAKRTQRSNRAEVLAQQSREWLANIQPQPMSLDFLGD
jgi:hypothetical protein